MRWKTRGEGGRVGDREEAGVTDPLKETYASDKSVRARDTRGFGEILARAERSSVAKAESSR